MKLFFFFAAALCIAGVQAQVFSVSTDIRKIYNRTDANVNIFVNNFIENLDESANGALDLFVSSWTTFKSVFLGFISITSPTFANIVDKAINVTVEAFVADYSEFWLRNATNSSFRTARSAYAQILQQYINNFNSTNVGYKCWNASKPQVVKLLQNFVNSTNNQSQPILADFQNLTLSEYGKLAQNLTSYGLQVLKECPLLMFWKVSECRDNFVSVFDLFSD